MSFNHLIKSICVRFIIKVDISLCNNIFSCVIRLILFCNVVVLFTSNIILCILLKELLY